MIGRRLILALAAGLLDDDSMKTALAASTEFEFDELNGVYYSPRAGRILFGQWNDTESNYWMKIVSDRGSVTYRDPYGYIDGGGYGPGNTYDFCCLAQPWKGQVLPVHIIPALQPVWSDTELLAYVDRWVEFGAWGQPDPCAPADSVDIRAGVWPPAAGRYGVTYGPAPGNAANCYLTQTCDCIRDTHSADGIGRWPTFHGKNVDNGYYGSGFVNSMWNMYRDSTFTGVRDSRTSPFHPAVRVFTISANLSHGTFRVTAGAPVRAIWLYDAAGQQMARLAVARGVVNWKAQCPQLGSGVYFASIDQGRNQVKLVLMK
jgi:hypothetical protein